MSFHREDPETAIASLLARVPLFASLSETELCAARRACRMRRFKAGDIAILDVPDLAAGPLKFAEYTAGSGVDVLVLGYPGGTSFHASPATVREVAEIKGPDIYRVATVKREVYVLNGSFPDTGSSGSAVIDLSGRVLGVYFGAETSNKTTGFAMTAAQVAPQMARVNVAQAADTQGCIY